MHCEWSIETGFRELKATLRGPGRVLRSRDPAGITQEIHALLCAHQLIHATRAAAAASAGLDPDKISCIITLRAVRRQIQTGPADPAAAARTLRTEILTQLLGPRRRRSYPRLARSFLSAKIGRVGMLLTERERETA